MNRRLVAALAAVLILAGACSSNSKSDDASGKTTTSAVATTTSTTLDKTPDPQKVSLAAGLNDPKDKTIAVLQFMPASATVKVGSTVTWSFTGPEPHSVSFFPNGGKPPLPGSDESLFAPTPPKAPVDGTTLVNSGLQPLTAKPATFSVSFAKRGDFTYYCVIHPGMVGKIKVIASGAESQADITTRGNTEQAEWLAEGRAAKKTFEAAKPKTEPNKSGGVTHFVEMGTTTKHTDILAFAPLNMDVGPKDDVEFIDNSQAPHTATFAGKQELPSLSSPDFTKQVAKVVPGPSPQALNLTDYFNTGQLLPNVGLPVKLRSFQFTIGQQGQYGYVCLLHVSSGMVGSLTVKS